MTADRLKPAGNDEEFALHRAALEWSLADPIVIHSIEDVKSRTEWREGFAPFEHQVQNLITFCRCLPVTLLADDVGLGKTISAALILCELMKRHRISRTLVLCPSILCEQWGEELETKVGIFARTAKGADLDRELRGQCPVVVTTYESGVRRLASVPAGAFDMLILDEAHKLRNLHGTAQPPKMAQKLHKALEQRLFKYVLMLTATPIHNRLWDLYSLISCLTIAKGHKNPLGEPAQFSARYIADAPAARRLRDGTQEPFKEILRQYVVRTRRQDAGLVFPDRRVDLQSVAATSEEIEMQRLVAEHLDGMNGLLQTSILTALMSSPQALLAQLNNMAERNPFFAELRDAIRRLVDPNRNFAKAEGLRLIIQELREKRPDDWRVLVFTGRKETQAAIGRMLEREGVKFGFISGGEANANMRTIKQFMNDRPEVSVVVSTDSGAEGVNLQKCNVLVNYDLPWNPMVVEQRIGRIQRLSSVHRFVTVFNLCLAGSPEQRVVARLMEKLQTISATVGDIEAILETTYGESKDTAESFAVQVRRLVVESLSGQDVELAMKKTEASLEKGKQLLKKRAGELDRTLGRLDALHKTGPAAPKVARTEPRLPHRQFVERALAARGATLSSASNGVFLASYADRPNEELTFDEEIWRSRATDGVFQGRAPKLYLPGKPDFERLVQHWIDHASHRVKPADSACKAEAEQLATNWLTRIPQAQLTGVEYTPSARQFAGTATVKAAVHNAVDSYEKLIDAPIMANDGLVSETFRTDQAGYVNDALEPAGVAADIRSVVRSSIETDQDVIAFSDFYERRLREELAKTAGDAPMEKKIIGDFQPTIHGYVLSLEGNFRTSGQLVVKFSIDGQGDYEAMLEGRPATGEVVTAPAFANCQETGAAVPENCLTRCQLTRKLVLKHLLVESAESGKLGLKKLCQACQETGRLVFPDELARCEITGNRVARSTVQLSAMSGRLGLQRLMETCDFTGARVLPAEILASQISGKRYRADEGAESSVSNQRGHRSEFIQCELTREPILASESVVSDVSGRNVRYDATVVSEKPPHRQGASDEAVQCDATGRRLLVDEAKQSAASGRMVDVELLVPSEESGRLALADEMVVCEQSGKRILPDEAGQSDVSGQTICQSLLFRSPIDGRRGRGSETAVCEFSSDRILADELVVSDYSGKRLRKDRAVASQLSERIGDRSEAVQCEYTGVIVLPDEAGRSALTQKRAALRALTPSEKSGRVGVASAGELVRCELTGKLLLRDETAASVISHKVVDRELLTPSDESGRLALAEEMFVCTATGKPILPAEAARSEVSGAIVRRRLLQASAIGGRLGLAEETVACELTGASVLRDELSVSEVSGARYRNDQSVVSEVSGRRGHASEGVECGYTGRLLLRDEAAQSAVSGKWALLAELTPSEKSQRLGRAASGEFTHCETTGRQLLSDEIAACEVTGKQVDVDLLVASAASGRRALAECLRSCEATGQRVLPDELALSDASGKSVLATHLRKSAASDRRCLQAEMKQCAFTDAWVLPDEIQVSQYSAKPFRSDEAIASAISSRTGHASEFVTCDYSRRKLLPDETSPSDATGRLAGVDLLAQSEHSKRKGVQLAGEVCQCESTGKRVLWDETAICAATGKRVVSELLVSSEASGLKGLPEAMVRCEKSGARLLPSETSHCEVSQQRVDSRLTIASGISGRHCLKEYAITCSVTRKTGLPDEVRICESSQLPVVVSKLKQCFATGKVTNEDLMLRSNESGNWLLKQHARQSKIVPGYYAAHELVQCQWLEEEIPLSHTAECQWTGLRFAASQLEASHHLSALSDLMSGKLAYSGGAHLGDWLKQLHPELFSGLHSVQIAGSPKKGVYAFVCEMHRAFGFKKRVAAFLASNHDPKRIIGKIALFRLERKELTFQEAVAASQ
ncbi:DEAD/DEAH box helicase [Lacipirellula parvula]|uniref:Helicase n=1 Tax=Lacipirellula parvula TaxID=2650471 RepID=A0A5K7XAJ3_9BACT|nr:SNF2-related protein [Lacipirellula parvula]BBO33558.1 hypothetical protein PLANPX_3170 [Lacipirellula parvula]